MEPLRRLQPHVLPGVVIVGAVGLGAGGPVFALFELEEVRMVLLFFPPVRVAAEVLVDAAVGVRHYKGILLPIRTHFGAVSV